MTLTPSTLRLIADRAEALGIMPRGISPRALVDEPAVQLDASDLARAFPGRIAVVRGVYGTGGRLEAHVGVCDGAIEWWAGIPWEPGLISGGEYRIPGTPAQAEAVSS